MRRRGLNDFEEEGGATGADSEGHVTGAANRQQVMYVLEMEECGKIRRKKKCKVARPNDKLVVRARVIYKRKMKDGDGESIDVDQSLKGSGRSKRCTTNPPQRQPEFGYIWWRQQPRMESCAALMQKRHSWRQVLARRYTFKIPREYQEFSEAWGC